MSWIIGLLAVIGHAAISTWTLNVLYGLPLPKLFLRAYRIGTGLWIAAYAAAFFLLWEVALFRWYSVACAVFAVIVFLPLTLWRQLKPRPACVLDEVTTTIDYWQKLGRTVVGDGKGKLATRLPFTCAFQVDFTAMTLAVPNLPESWDGLRIQLITDLHFHGTPSRSFFDAVIDHLRSEPTPDLVIFGGDTIDTDEHLDWIEPVLGRLEATEGRYAILGNHDAHHKPKLIRQALERAGYNVIGNDWQILKIRGNDFLLIGHEGPWFRPAPDMTTAATGIFRLCISHTPDQFRWAKRHGVNLMLCGHTHGGQIRIPGIGSIFVPSVYSRRYEMGVFESESLVMVVNRGLSGKEPLRFRCHPQVMTLTLRHSDAPSPPAAE